MGEERFASGLSQTSSLNSHSKTERGEKDMGPFMELRIDRLLAALRERPEEILAAIDADPLLVKREAHGLVLANATKGLFTPQAEYQLFAKGIVYRRDPYRLVSLPLLKIYNLGERNVTVADIAELVHENARVHFLRKFDGSMIQRFQHEGRVHFTTRGILEGVALSPATDEDGLPQAKGFDYLAAARNIAKDKYPKLLEAIPAGDELTLILELLHPDARVITDYRGRKDLILLAAFDHRRHAYLTVSKLNEFAATHGLTVTDVLTPAGTTLAERIDALIAALVGSDEEGTVLVLEHGDEVIYRVKVKSPDYLKLLRLMLHCSYDATAAMLDSFAEVPNWETFEKYLKSLGTEKVPEEIVEQYRAHYDAFIAYLGDCERLRAWAQSHFETMKAELPSGDIRAVRKVFAERAKRQPHAPLLFSALDGRLSVKRIREHVSTPIDVSDALARVRSAAGNGS